MTNDEEQISRGFAQAFREAGDVRVDTNIDSQLRASRQRELEDWSLDAARHLAAEEGIELDAARLRVIHCLRDHYLQHGLAHTGRELGDLLNERFAVQGGRSYLRRLFPDGPVAQGMKIAGLAVPADTRDAGFGTAR
jgi:TusE/DsrC/DsvC family sulfur relay protein